MKPVNVGKAVATATSYSWLQDRDTFGVSLKGPYGNVAIWADGTVEVPTPAVWGYHAPYTEKDQLAHAKAWAVAHI